MVADLFCSPARPSIRSLVDLQAALHVTPGAESAEQRQSGREDAYYVRFPVLLAHSTALSGHLVSPLNPRALLLGIGTVLTFQRGVQRVEIATLARDEHAFNFYLLRFKRACDAQPDGCSPAERYTARIERDWLSFDVSDAEDLKNTPLDCRQCHQRGREHATLLMRELERPWTHFFLPLDTVAPHGLPGVQGGDLMSDYMAAHEDEPYANVDVRSYPEASPQVLEIIAGRDQPVFFDSVAIQDERYPLHDGVYPSGPASSPTWERAFGAFKHGEQLALPYLEPRATDPDKQARLSELYLRHRRGELPDDELPDLADIFPDDPALRARIGLATDPEATPAEALIQACGPCHNDVLDQSISRARFNIDVSRLDARELDLAIERLSRAANSTGVMPPPEARQLAPGALEGLLDYLRGEARSGRVDPQLARAARLGMAGGAREGEESP